MAIPSATPANAFSAVLPELSWLMPCAVAQQSQSDADRQDPLGRAYSRRCARHLLSLCGPVHQAADDGSQERKDASGQHASHRFAFLPALNDLVPLMAFAISAVNDAPAPKTMRTIAPS